MSSISSLKPPDSEKLRLKLESDQQKSKIILLSSELNSYKKTNKDLAQKLTESQKEVSDLKRRIAELVEESGDRESKMALLESQLSQRDECIKNLRERVHSSDHEVIELKARNSTLELEVSRLEINLSGLAESRQKQAKEMKAEIDKCIKKNKKLRCELDLLREENVDLKIEVEKKTKKMNNWFVRANSRVNKNRLDENERERSQNRSPSKYTGKSKLSRQSRKIGLKAYQEANNKSRSPRKKKIRDAEIQKLTKDNSRLQKEKKLSEEKYEEKIDAQRARIAWLQKRIIKEDQYGELKRKVLSEMANYHQKVKNLKNELLILEEDIDKKKATQKQIQAAIEFEDGLKLSQIQRDVTFEEKRLKGVREELSALESKLREEKGREELTNKIKKLERKNKKLMTENHQIRKNVAEVGQKLEQTKKELRQEKKSSSNLIVEMNKKLQQITAEKRKLEENLVIFDLEKIELQTKLDHVSKTLKEVKNEFNRTKELQTNLTHNLSPIEMSMFTKTKTLLGKLQENEIFFG